MDLTSISGHPLTLIITTIGGFFLKDLFFQIKQGSEGSGKITLLEQRVTKLEHKQDEVSDLKIAIVRLEEQVKNLTKLVEKMLMKVDNDKA